MSRGLGKVEQAVLHAMRTDDRTFRGRRITNAGSFTAVELAAKLHDGAYSDSELVSLRRALRSLERKGLVEVLPRHRMIPVWIADDPAGFVRRNVYKLSDDR